MFASDSNAREKAQELSEYLSERGNFLSHNRRIGRNQIQDETDMAVSKLEADQRLQDIVLSVFHATTATHSHENAVKIIENQHGSLYSRQIRE